MKRILISTKNGFKLRGYCYEVDNNSPKLDVTSHTQQDLKEFVKAANQYRVNAYEIDYWITEIV